MENKQRRFGVIAHIKHDEYKAEKSLKSFLFTFLIIALASCHDDPEPKPICSCEAKVSSTYSDVQGIMVNTLDGFMFLSPYKGYYEICHDLDAGLQVDGLMLTAEGQLKSTCLKPDDIFKTIDLSFVNLNSWNIAQDSLFNQFPIKIKIIKSEDFGYAPGFGYDVQTSDGGFHIRQPTMPAVGGNIPFKTETDAFKTAVLVAYKLNTDTGLPALTVQDLQFLKVFP